MSTFRLADELFLIGHDAYTGRTAVQSDVFDTGLAGAVLAELLLDRRISCADGRVGVADPRAWGEPVSDAALLELRRRGPGYVMRAWVEHLRPTARDSVGRRLADVGVVRREEVRGLLARRTRVRYPGVDPTTCTLPQVRLKYLLERPGSIHPYMATLAALVLATGLDHQLAVTMSRQQVRAQLAEITDRLPAELRALIGGVRTAVAAIALTVRR
ncbi:GPP34 family phosphoprotein [Micromonospora sp. NPDC049679]|uniref:GOLPH3/VPS74 family protein n=1 Tax=Micromonospora sp. NPDC049679 TaxID=3155920 RepID=UPI0033CCB12E